MTQDIVINDRRHSAKILRDPNRIPPMTDPMGKGWDQPSSDLITIDDKYALMSKHTFEQLADYSGTNPSGVYEGKMWRRNDGEFDPVFLAKGGKPEWLLVWYGHSDKPGFVSNNYRKIIIV